MTGVNTKARNNFFFLFLLFQVTFLILYRTIATYTPVGSSFATASAEFADAGTYLSARVTDVSPLTYLYYSHIIVLTLVGYGYLLTFGRNGSISALFYTFLLAATVLQWSLVVNEFWYRVFTDDWNTNFELNVTDLINASYTTVTILITAAILLGKASIFQLVFLAIVEVDLYGLNQYILRDNLNIPTYEHHLFVHEFGAFFGLGALFFIGKRVKAAQESQSDASLTPYITSLLGTLFIFAFFPSFNAALVPAAFQSRVIVNTFLALTSSVVVTFLFSGIFNNGLFCPVEVRNAAIAGGIAISSSIGVVNGPAAACGTGLVAALAALFGIRRFTPFIAKFGFHDSSNFFSVNFFASLVGGVGTMITLADANSQGTFYGADYVQFYPSGYDASPNHVAAYFITFGIAFLSGLICGFVFSGSFFQPHTPAATLKDTDYVVLPHKNRSIPAPVVVAAPAPAAPKLTRVILATYGAEDAAKWLESLNLANSAELVRKDGITGDDILNAQQVRLTRYFGDASGNTIWNAIGAMGN